MTIPTYLKHIALATLIAVSAAQAENNHQSICNRVRFFPSPGSEQAMVGGRFEGSNVSHHNGFKLLAEIRTAPTAKQWSELKFDNTKVYRWLRFVGPAGATVQPGKIEFYSGDRLIAGREQRRGVFLTSFTNDHQDDNVVAFDVLEAAGPRPSFKPDRAEQDGPVDVTIGFHRGATVRYTLDGSLPTMEHGTVYTGPIHIEKTATITAVAFLPDRAPSLPVVVTYLLRGSSKPGLSSAHVGNSLTGTTGNFWRYACTAGYDHHSVAFLRGGALTRELWALASGEFASDKQASAKEAANREKGGVPWADFWSKVGPIDLLTMQPRDFDLDTEVAAEINFIKLFRQKSPDLQPWLYCEWVELKRERPSDKGEVPSSQMKKTFPALTWEESMSAMLVYVEELQRRLCASYHEGKRPRVLPAALAMGWIKNMIDHGQFPEAKAGTFYSLLFKDQVHPGVNGAYLVDMTWYSAFYDEAPEGKVLPIETTFTPEQARAVERLAWDVIKNYPDCGLYEEGTTPCGKPEFASNGKVITLKSSTPGAWFRYTLDGTTPTRTNGYVYCGVISLREGITLQAVAYKSGMADSIVAGFDE